MPTISERFSLLHWIQMNLTPGKLYILCVSLMTSGKLIRWPEFYFNFINFEIVMPTAENCCEVC